ncbi:MAG: DivIVA domain-containing protein [Clostridia bacterium]|nr:DivIVA domain-containing protein [Clostridia bacterium]
MITPKEIETKEFTSTKGGGYKGDEVDQFLDEILVDYTRLLEERNALKNKVNLLTEKLNELADTPAAPAVSIPEPFVAPVVAQNPSEELEAARKKAQMLVADAEDYAKKLIETAQYEANRQNTVTQKLSAEIESFKNSLMDMYTAHIKMIEEIPNTKFEDVKIGSETLDILNQSFNDSAAPAVVTEVSPAEKYDMISEDANLSQDIVDFDDDLFEKSSKRASEKRVSKGLEDLFDDEDTKKKKEPKKKKKLFFRDEDDDDDDFFDDDDED